VLLTVTLLLYGEILRTIQLCSVGVQPRSPSYRLYCTGYRSANCSWTIFLRPLGPSWGTGKHYRFCTAVTGGCNCCSVTILTDPVIESKRTIFDTIMPFFTPYIWQFVTSLNYQYCTIPVWKNDLFLLVIK